MVNAHPDTHHTAARRTLQTLYSAGIMVAAIIVIAVLLVIVFAVVEKTAR